MNLTDEQLDALAERLGEAFRRGPHFTNAAVWRAVAREAARWAEEQQGEVVWERMSRSCDGWLALSHEQAKAHEIAGHPVRAIRVIATTTKEGA